MTGPRPPYCLVRPHWLPGGTSFRHASATNATMMASDNSYNGDIHDDR